MLPTIIKAEPTSDSDHQEHLTILIASGKGRKWFDKISLMSKGKNHCKAQEWGSFTSHLHSMSYKMEITEDEKQAVADVTNYHQSWTHKWFRSSRASNYSHCKWKAKKMIWQDLTHDQVKRLSEKDVEKYFKKCETSLSAWTCNGNVKAVLKLLCKALAHFLPVDEGELLKDLNKNFMVERELSIIVCRLSLNHGKYMAITSVAFLMISNVEYDLTLPPEKLDKNLASNWLRTCVRTWKLSQKLWSGW